MSDSARAYFDTFFSLAGDSGHRARDFADRVRDDLRSGADRLREDFRSGADQVRTHGSRTVSDIGRLIRAEVDAGLSRMGVATQADLDDVNLRLELAENEIRDLRVRLAEATAAPVTDDVPAPATDDRPSDEEDEGRA